MALVIRLKDPDRPASPEGWAFVQRAERGYLGCGMLAHQQRGTTQFISPSDPEADLEQAIARAVHWADRHGVPTVYVSP